MIILLFSFLTVFPFKLIENPCGTMFPRGGDRDWGFGGFFIPVSFELPLYYDTSGAIYGKINNIGLFDINNRNVDINGEDFESVANQPFLKLKKCQSTNYYRCLWKSKNEGLFINKSDLDKLSFNVYSYQELLYRDKEAIKYIPVGHIAVNIERSCLNLREGPSIKYPVISCIGGNDINMEGQVEMTIIKHTGAWAKVEVRTLILDNNNSEESEDGPCPSILISKRIGWIRVIDKSGFPNIWFSLPGY